MLCWNTNEQDEHGFTASPDADPTHPHSFDQVAAGFGFLEGCLYDDIKGDLAKNHRSMIVDSAAMAFNTPTPNPPDHTNDAARFVELMIAQQGGRLKSDELNIHAYGSGPNLSDELRHDKAISGVPKAVFVSEMGLDSRASINIRRASDRRTSRRSTR